MGSLTVCSKKVSYFNVLGYLFYYQYYLFKLLVTFVSSRFVSSSGGDRRQLWRMQ